MKKSLLMVLLMAGMLVVPAGLTLNPLLSAAQAARPKRPKPNPKPEAAPSDEEGSEPSYNVPSADWDDEFSGIWNVAVIDDDPAADKISPVNGDDRVTFKAGEGVNIDMNSVPGDPDPSGEGRLPSMHTITISAVPPAEYFGWTLKANGGTDGEELIQDYWFVNFKNGEYTSVTVAPSEEEEATSDVTIDLNDETKKLLAGLGEGSGGSVVVEAGKNMTVTPTEEEDGTKKFEVTLNDRLELGNSEEEGALVVDGDTRTITNLSNTTLDAEDFGTAGRAATEEQLKAIIAEMDECSDNCVTYDDPEGKDKVTLGGVETTEPVALTNVKEGGLSADSTDAVNGSQLFETNEKVAENSAALEKMETEGVWKVSAEGGTAEPVKLGEQVDLAGDKNIAVSLDPASVNGKFHALKLQLSKNLDLSETGSVTMGGTVVNNEGLTIAGGPSVTQKGIDAGGKRITNVAPGQDDSDAATLGQVKELAGGMGGFVTPRLDEMDRRIDSVGAMAAAFSAMIPLDYDEEHPTQVSVGFGHYSGENAIAFGVMHYANRDLLFNAGVAICHDEKSFRAGATFRLGESPEAPSAIEAGKTVRVSTTEIALMRRVEAQDAALADQQRQIQALTERLEKLAPAN